MDNRIKFAIKLRSVFDFGFNNGRLNRFQETIRPSVAIHHLVQDEFWHFKTAWKVANILEGFVKWDHDRVVLSMEGTKKWDANA
jgi:hypothetical protein